MKKNKEHIEACRRIIERGTCLSNTVFCSNLSNNAKAEKRAAGWVECPIFDIKGPRCCVYYTKSAQNYLDSHKPSAIQRLLAWLAERLYDPNPQDDETHAATRYAMMDKEADK